MCWPPKRRVYNITSSSLLHRKYVLLLCYLLKVSLYRLALIDTASLSTLSRVSPSVSIIVHEPVGLSLSLNVTRGSLRWSRLLSLDPVVVRAHTFFPRGGAFFCWSVLLLECTSAGVSFCWRGWRTLLLAWLEELQLEVYIGSTRLLRGPD